MKRTARLFNLLHALTQARPVFLSVKRVLCFHIKWQTILTQYRFHKHIDRNRNIHPGFITKFFKSAFIITVHTNAKGSLCHSIILHRVVLIYTVYHTLCYFVNTVCGMLCPFLYRCVFSLAGAAFSMHRIGAVGLPCGWILYAPDRCGIFDSSRGGWIFHAAVPLRQLFDSSRGRSER